MSILVCAPVLASEEGSMCLRLHCMKVQYGGEFLRHKIVHTALQHTAHENLERSQQDEAEGDCCLTGVACAAARASCAATWLLFFLAARLTMPSGRGPLAAKPGARAGFMGNTGSCAPAGASSNPWAARGAVASNRLRDAEHEERHSTSSDSTAGSLAAIAGARMMTRACSALLSVRCAT